MKVQFNWDRDGKVNEGSSCWVRVAQRLTEAGLPWRFGNSFYRGERVFRMEAPRDSAIE